MKEFLLINMIFLLCSCSYLNTSLGLKDDNLGEEIIEKMIEHEFGVDIDLTPNTLE